MDHDPQFSWCLPPHFHLHAARPQPSKGLQVRTWQSQNFPDVIHWMGTSQMMPIPRVI